MILHPWFTSFTRIYVEIRRIQIEYPNPDRLRSELGLGYSILNSFWSISGGVGVGIGIGVFNFESILIEESNLDKLNIDNLTIFESYNLNVITRVLSLSAWKPFLSKSFDYFTYVNSFGDRRHSLDDMEVRPGAFSARDHNRQCLLGNDLRGAGDFMGVKDVRRFSQRLMGRK
jgi:hypothetical protein